MGAPPMFGLPKPGYMGEAPRPRQHDGLLQLLFGRVFEAGRVAVALVRRSACRSSSCRHWAGRGFGKDSMAGSRRAGSLAASASANVPRQTHLMPGRGASRANASRRLSLSAYDLTGA